MSKMIFLNLAVADLARSVAFYEAIGATKNPQFSDATAACMVLSETIQFMLLTHDKYRQFTNKPIGDSRTTSQVLVCFSAESRAEVDATVEKAGALGVADPKGLQGLGRQARKERVELGLVPALRRQGRKEGLRSSRVVRAYARAHGPGQSRGLLSRKTIEGVSQIVL